MPKERGKGIDRKPGVAGIERKHYFVDEATRRCSVREGRCLWGAKGVLGISSLAWPI